MTTLFNANPRSAYRAGFYTGTHRIDEVLAHGNFGLGALGRNDGELVVLDGQAYRTAYDGSTGPVGVDATTPYATVLPFTPERTTRVGDLDDTGLEGFLAEWLPLATRIWAVRVRGTFRYVEAGAGQPQPRPYRPMAEVMPDYGWHRHEDTTGTLVGFHCPPFLLGQNLVGLHTHWLSDDRAQGGHVRGFAIADAELAVAEATTYTVDIADEDDLHALDLTPTN